jgi:PEP-CTERM motif
MNKLTMAACAALLLTAVSAQGAGAGTIPYPDAGTVNPIDYTFKAASTGDVNAYFFSSDAGDLDLIGILDTTQGTSISFGLPNHMSNVGDAYGPLAVNVGDTLVFEMENTALGNTGGESNIVYSDASLNGPFDFSTPGAGTNHVYSTSYSSDGSVFPVGTLTYVAFEDLPRPVSDLDYNDSSFLVSNVTTGVPEPASWAVMLLGFGAVGAIARSRRRVAAVA